MNRKEANEYKRVQNAMKQKFNQQSIEDQTQYIDQTKLLKPLIEVQNESSKLIQDKIASNQDALSNALVPFTTEMKRRNDQADFPFVIFPREIEDVSKKMEDVPQSSPIKKDTYDLHKLLNETDIENLQDMSLPLPSEVMIDKNYEDVLDKIKTLNRKHGQYLGGGKASKKDQKERDILESHKVTLQKYKETMEDQMTNRKYKSGEGLRKRSLYKLKRGRGRPKQYPDTKIVTNADEIMDDLEMLLASKSAGNTGVDNEINSALDALRKYKVINNDQYQIMYKNIFK